MSTSTWRIVEWSRSGGGGGSAAELNASVKINTKDPQQVRYTLTFGSREEIEISADDAKILIAARAAEK